MTIIRNRATAALAAAMFVACAVPGLASAAGEPQITSAGLDARDRLYATWQLAPGTVFDFVEFSTVPIPSLDLPDFFADGNLAAFECADDFCDGPPRTATSYTSMRQQSRDRRYFVRVVADAAASPEEDDDWRTSAIWEIDVTKPILPGGWQPAGEPTNMPVGASPYTPPAPETIPVPALTLVAPPRKIATVLRRGIRARLTCPVAECFGKVELRLGNEGLDRGDGTARAGGRRTLVLKPPLKSPERRRLAGRDRARLRIVAKVIQPGGKRTTLERTLVVRR